MFVIIAATVISTLNDYLDSPILSSFLTSSTSAAETPAETSDTSEETPQTEKPKDGLLNQILNCFSVKRNIALLFGVTESENEVKCLHGLKALSIMLLFISFKLIPMGRVPYANRNKLTEFFNSPLSVFVRSSFLYEDVFFVISGVLASFSVMKILSTGAKIQWVKKLISRYLRLVLPLSVVLLFYAFVWEHLGTGPQWSSVVEKNADLCKENMWRNLLFIQNLYPFENMVRYREGMWG